MTRPPAAAGDRPGQPRRSPSADERHGRRRVLLLTLVGSAASMGLAAAAGSLGLLVLAPSKR